MSNIARFIPIFIFGSYIKFIDLKWTSYAWIPLWKKNISVLHIVLH
jgi:hypothetical protein